MDLSICIINLELDIIFYVQYPWKEIFLNLLWKMRRVWWFYK